MILTRACVIILTSACFISCLDMLLERARVTYVNEKYLESAYINVSRSTRKAEYMINGEFVNKVTFDDNLTIHLIFREFLSNRYVPTFIEFHFTTCKLLKEPLIGMAFIGQGFKCPILPGKYVLKNMKGHADDFSNVFPFERGLIQYQFNVTDTNEGVAVADVYIKFVNHGKKKKIK